MSDKTAKPAPVKVDPKATHLVRTLKHNRGFLACRFDPTGRYVVAGSQDNAVHRFDLNDGKRTALARHDSWVRGLGFSPDGKTLFTGGNDGRLIWWPLTDENPEPTRVLDAHAGWIRHLSVSPDGSLVATGGNDRLVKLWNTADGKLVRTLSGHPAQLYSTLFHPGGEILLTGDLHGEIRQWETSTGKLARSFDAKALHTYHGGQQAHYGGVRSLSLSADGKYLAAAGLHKATNPYGGVQEPLVLLYDWKSQKKLQSHVAGIKRGIAWRAIHHPAGFLMGVSGGSDGGFLLFWKPDAAAVFHKFKLPNTAHDLDLHPDTVQVATAHSDNTIRISRLAAKKKA